MNTDAWTKSLDVRQYATHRNNVDQYLDGTECDLEVGADWPYECVAKDAAGPSTTVIRCHRHNTWWTETSVEGR